MKNIIKLVIILIGFSCKAQSPVINLAERDGSRISNAYYKDIDNLLNPFEGTWVYTDGSTSFKIVFLKKEMTYRGNYYEDILIGEYQYIRNGEELFNSLSEVDVVLPFEINHHIAGNNLPTTPTPFGDYTTDNFRVKLCFEEDNGFGCNINVRKTVVSGVEAIQIFKVSRPPLRKNGVNYPGNAMIKDGFYTLVKVP
jgi:hypothetical protein